MHCDILEVWQTVGTTRNAVAVIFDGQVVSVVLLSPRNGDGLGPGIDAVLDELCDCRQRVALRERNDANRVPIVADAKFTAVALCGFHELSRPPIRFDTMRSNPVRIRGPHRSVKSKSR